MTGVGFALTIVGKFPPKTKRAGNRVACGRGADSLFGRLSEVSKSVVVKQKTSIFLNLLEKGKSLANFNKHWLANQWLVST